MYSLRPLLFTSLLFIACMLWCAPVSAQFIPTVGTACGDGSSSFWEQAGICVSNLWQRPAFQFGAATQSCASGTAGMIQWTGSALQYCDGSNWNALGGSTTINLGTSAAATNPQRSGQATTGLFSAATNTVSLATGGTEAMRIDSSQRVGIGTTSPATLTQIYGTAATSTPLLTITNTATNGYNDMLDMYSPNTTASNNVEMNIGKSATTNNAMFLNFAYIGAGSSSNQLEIGGYNQSTAMAILASGNVGIGTTAPAATLDIAGTLYSRRVALTDGATVAVDWSKGNIQSVTLGGNRTFTFSNPVDGARYILFIKQDATGSRTATWPATVRWPGGTAPTLTTTASKTDYITFIYNGVDSKYDGVALSQNF